MPQNKKKNNRRLKKIALFVSALVCVLPVSGKTEKSKKRTTKDNDSPSLTITYNKNHAINDVWGVYVIKSSDGKTIKLTQEDLNGYKITEQENKLHEEIFSDECKIAYQYIDWNKALDCAKKEKCTVGNYMVGKNVINICRSAETKENILKKLRLAEENNNGDELIACAYLWLLKSIEEEPEQFQEIFAHEESHQESDAQGVNKVASVTGKQSAKLDMLNEIKATIAQVTTTYEKFLRTGDINDLKGSNAGELTNFKQWIMFNQDKLDSQECKEKLAEDIYLGFLENNNQKGQYYYYQVMKRNHAVGRQAGAIVENSANMREYYRRVDMMFKDTALGDVRRVINPDFKLGAGTLLETKEDIFNEMSIAEKFISLLSDEAITVEEATDCIKDMLENIKKADEDGIRTRREQKLIDKTIMEILNQRTIS